MATSDEPNLYRVTVPRDVEADLVAGLSAFGLNVRTLVPADVESGTTRISRIGGELTESGQRDEPKVMVDVWGDTAVDAFDQAIAVYAAIRAMGKRGWITPEATMHNLDLQAPRAADDPDAPMFYRVQFLAEYVTDLTVIDIQEATHG